MLSTGEKIVFSIIGAIVVILVGFLITMEILNAQACRKKHGILDCKVRDTNVHFGVSL
jgi:hypothetical protein